MALYVFVLGREQPLGGASMSFRRPGADQKLAQLPHDPGIYLLHLAKLWTSPNKTEMHARYE